MGTPRNFSNTASGASLSADLSAGGTTATLNNYSNFPPVPFTATIARNQADEEIVLVTAVAASTVTMTRGYDGTTAQAHVAGASFEHTAVAKDFQDSQSHVNATAAHGTTSQVAGVDDVQTFTNKTVRYLKGLATNAAAAFEADNDTGQSGKLFRGLSAGVEKFFVDYLGNLTAQAISATTGAFSGALTAAAGTFSGLLSANGGLTIPTGKRATLTDAPTAGTDAANKSYVDTKAPLASPTFTGKVTSPTLDLTSIGDAGPTTDGALVIGSRTGANLTIDNNEIVARNNGAIAGLTLAGSSSVSVPTPTASTHAATKGYVDGLTQTIASGTAAQAGSVPGAGAAVQLRGGSVVFTPDSGGQATVSFDSAFPHAVLAVTLSPGSTGQNMAMIELVSVTTSSITVLCRNYTGAVIAAGSVRLDYIALGC